MGPKRRSKRKQNPEASIFQGYHRVKVVKSTLVDRKDTTETLLSDYIPETTYQVVKYARKGEKSLTSVEKESIKFIELHYVVPKDFEVNKLRYGNLSGLSYEQRLIRAYRLQLLRTKSIVTLHAGELTICLTCGKKDHAKDTCPDGF